MLDEVENVFKIPTVGFHLFENHKVTCRKITAGNWKGDVDQLIFSAIMKVKGTITSVLSS